MDYSLQSLRRNDRITKFSNDNTTNESINQLVINSIQLLESLNPAAPESSFLDDITNLLHNIEKMSQQEIDALSGHFPYDAILDLIIISQNENIQDNLFKSLFLMSGGKYFPAEEFILPHRLTFLFVSLDTPKFSSYSFNLLFLICEEVNEICQILCEQGLLDKFLITPLDEIKSRFILLLCIKIRSPEFQVQLTNIVYQMMQSKSLLIIKIAMKSYFAIFIQSKDQIVKESVNQISSFLVQNFHQFLQIDDVKIVAKYLNFIACIEELPVDMIPYIMQLLNSDSIKIARASANILTLQWSNWKDKIDIDQLYNTLFTKIDLDISIDNERIFFTTLLRYGLLKHLQLPRMMYEIINFCNHPKCTTDCLKAILMLLSTTTSSKKPQELFGDLTEEVYKVASEQYEKGTDEDSAIAIQILNYLEN